MHDDSVARSGRLGSVPGLSGLRDRMLLRGAARLLARLDGGAFHLTLPSGEHRRLGPPGGQGVEADAAVRSFKLLWRTMTRGHLGFAESYLRGEVETRSLADIFRYAIDHAERLEQVGGGVFRVRTPDRRAHSRRDNTRDGSRRNIADHYDLGNAFYEAWLDPGMTYSSAVFTGPEVSLAAAQDEKYARVIAALGLEDGHRVLEIGCGWGGFAEAAARSGAFVDGITLSREQLAYASERIARAGLDARVRLRFEDYRDTTGGFDRIASIEMVEAVGEPHWPVYFATLHDRLVPGGVAVLQAITIREQSYAAYRERPDFIQRYVFPGGMLPTRAIMADQAERAGLTFEPLETFGASYARTLAIWRDRFEAAWPRIAALGFDDRFRRLWNFYLTYCEVGFERGVVDVGLYRFTRPA